MKVLDILTAILTLVAFALGQEQYSITPSSVPLATRQYWCQSQETQCPLICLQVGNTLLQTRQNDCSATTLTFSCICQNGVSPNVTKYSLTLPYFICTEWGTQCVAACGSDSHCASDCRDNHPCGAQDTSPPNKTIIAASKSAAAASASKTQGGQTAHTGFADGSNSQGAAGQVRPPVFFGLNGSMGSMVVIGALVLVFNAML